jgi:hypothetical protein
MLSEQGNCCAICKKRLSGKGRSTDSPTVDHCHKTGRVRGILCNPCNRVLGLMKENKETFAAAIKYLGAADE